MFRPFLFFIAGFVVFVVILGIAMCKVAARSDELMGAAFAEYLRENGSDDH